jgi:hypothetical protein
MSGGGGAAGLAGDFRSVGVRGGGWFVAHNYRPFADVPALNEAIDHVGIVAGEILGCVGLLAAKDEERAVGGFGKGAGENQFTAGVGIAGEFEVFIAIGTATVHEIVYHFIKESEVAHGFLEALRNCSKVLHSAGDA